MSTRLFHLVLAAAVSATLVGAATAPAFAGTLDIKVEGVRSAKGTVRAGVYDARDRLVAHAAAAAETGRVTLKVRDLAPGAYAVKLFHDEDGNERLDFDGCGIPTEGYGFSNGVRALLGPPSFDEMRVSVDGDAETVAVLGY